MGTQYSNLREWSEEVFVMKVQEAILVFVVEPSFLSSYLINANKFILF
jgi:hypothetical protein